MKENMTEQALRKSEKKYRTLVEHFPNGAVGLFDRNLRYTAVGGELVETLDVSPEDRIGNKITEIYPDEIVDEVEPHFQATFEGEENSFEAEFHGRHLSAQTLPIKDDNEKVTAGMLLVQDITERWEARRALRRSEKKYRTLFETMEEGFCILNLKLGDDNDVVDFRYEEVNDSFKQHTGLDDVEGKKGSEVLKDSQKDWLKMYADVAVTGEPEHFEYYSESLDRWFEISAFRIGNPQERKVAGLFNNITKRKQFQEKLRTMNKNLGKKVEERTKSLVGYQNQLRSLVSELSNAEEQERQRLAADLHDNLGQMLAMGKMYIEQAKAKNPPDDITGDLVDLEELIEDALTYTRELTSDLKPPSSLDEEDLSAHIKWVAEKVEKHGLEVKIEDDEQPKALDEEVQMTILQCVRELLFNIVKHASVDEAAIRMKRNRDLLQITVKDEGEGFNTQHKELKPDKEGGFGLFSIRERIDLLGGKMDIQSKPGKGTSVHLYVPLKGRGPEEILSAEGSRKSESSRTIKILVAQEHRMIRESIRSIIEKEPDMTVIGEADSGEQAVAMALERAPDVVLMEINLPGLSAVEVTKNILAGNPEIDIIGFSEQDDQNVVEDMREAGISAYVHKKEAFRSLASSIRAEASVGQGE